jgi:hypothetical protein
MLAMESGGGTFSINAFIDRLGDREQKIVSELAFHQLSASPEEAAAQAISCLRALEATGAQHEQTELRRRIKSAESSGDIIEALRLASELKRRDVATGD